MSSTRLFEAASISVTSRARPSRMATHDGQASHGSPSRRFGAVDRLGEDARHRGLAGAARTDEQVGVGDPPGPDRVAERLDHGRLPDDLVERLGAPAAVESLVRLVRAQSIPAASASHSPGGRAAGRSKCRAPSVDRRPRAHPRRRLGPGLSAAPDGHCLVLLPSGSDTVRTPSSRGTRSSAPPREAAARTWTSGGNSALLERIAGTGHR